MIHNTKLYHYKSININDELTHGTIQADNKQLAKNKLKNSGNIIITIKKKQITTKKNNEKIQLLQQVNQLLKAKIPMIDIIQIIKPLKNTHEKMTQGFTFSQSIGNEWITPSERNILSVGEASGKITEAIDLIIFKINHQIKRQNQIKKVMAYPIMVLIIAISTCIGMLINIIPQFRKLFESFNAKLPKSTILLIQLSDFLVNHFILIILSITILILTTTYLFNHNETFNQKIKIIFMSLPIIRRINELSFKNQWASLLSICLDANMSFNSAFKLSLNLSPIHTWASALQQSLQAIQSGATIAKGLGNQPWLNSKDIQMIHVGEKSQQLSTTLASIAQISHQELNQITDNIQLWLEPITLLLISIIIGSILIALYSPIFKIGSIM